MTDIPDNLTETRARDREKMAAILAEAMVAAGAKAVAAPCDYAPRRIDVRIEAPGGAHIRVDFDGGSCQPNVHVATWNVPAGLRGDARVFFNPQIGDVNDYHYGKAMRVCRGFADLVRQLVADVGDFADGSGYLDHDDERIVAMKREYARRGWRW